MPLLSSKSAKKKKDKAVPQKVTPRSTVKAKSDIYTVMLGVSLAAVLIACLFLFLEMRRYEFDFQAESPNLRASLSARAESTLV